MLVTIEGTLQQVADAMGLGKRPVRARQQINASADPVMKQRARKGTSARARRGREIHERRKLVHAAFVIVKGDPAEAALAQMLARALGKGEITPTILKTAAQVTAERKETP